MGLLSESICFCKGLGKSERMKGAIFTTKSPAMAQICGAGTGFLIHRNLLLTTHANLPSTSAAESAEIQLQNVASATLFPHRFFITSSVLDLTIVGLDYNLDGDSNPHNGVHSIHYLKTCQKSNLDLGSIVYLLGYRDKELTIGEAKVVIATDNLIKLSASEVAWDPGSAGFDSQGNLAFMICDPMKLATSPNTRSSSTSSFTSPSSKKDQGAQFGIPIPIIYDWLNQHWEGSLDEPNGKPKLPIMRLMSTGARAEHSSASFTLRPVFKSTEAGDNDADDDDGGNNLCSSNQDHKAHVLANTSCTVPANTGDGETKSNTNPPEVRLLGIPTPEIYETPKVTSVPARRKESNPVQLLDINFPPRFTKPALPLQPPKIPIPHSDENSVRELQLPHLSLLRNEEEDCTEKIEPINPQAVSQVSSSGSVQAAESKVESCALPLEACEMNTGFSSEEETMYSAETAESRNYTSPREGRFQNVGRNHSCAGHSRWVPQASSTVTARRAMLEKQRSFIHGRKVHSQGANSQRSNDYYNPTVSSIMKKRGNLEHHHLHPHQQQQQPTRTRQSAVNSSPRWIF
ncbi:hypothetical protein SAY86_021368 [Trapa natans]|uniref:Uncharacterized protein n=1 Tax=Trapa natans TaxID=22666 RepID=A0AAN7RK17_TRANT|nr:hypothetical protein SAY86_021368 [Trapa natans]